MDENYLNIGVSNSNFFEIFFVGSILLIGIILISTWYFIFQHATTFLCGFFVFYIQRYSLLKSVLRKKGTLRVQVILGVVIGLSKIEKNIIDLYECGYGCN